MMKFNRKTPHRLTLGKKYVLWYNYKQKFICQFIQPTKCGFNFLNINTHKCILKYHLYPSKYEKHRETGDWFFLNNNLQIEEYYESI